ncbi:DUF368 domain-containing protein [Aminipila butyrica]|uniref:DUF368 domain-containing protein n=1 Tax=Aminipila butyrica TaxID=433296 RepID=A0A858BVA5_9FIRM|nr:DUF368 domain-containing protein [Aminipila butyrica]QIB69119.1 DUF368 domain-containing protein [Aminipila butyrica]
MKKRGKIRDEHLLVRLVKGFIVGASMLIPGVSGGTMAIILGIYDDLIHAVNALKRDLRKYGLLLVQYGGAGVAGIILLSGPMLKAVTLWEKPMMFLFLGAILGSFPPLYRKATASKVKNINKVAVVLGAAIAYLITLFPKGLLAVEPGFHLSSFFMLLAAGVVIAVALILPGISASYVLLMLGMYDLTLMAIRDVDLAYLTPLVVGVLGGTFLTAGIIEMEMDRHPQFTYMLIMGFMVGSLMEVFPGVPQGAALVQSTVMFLVGLGVILWIGKAR